MDETLRLVVDCRCALAEGLSWDARDGAILWVDIVGADVFRHLPATGETSRMHLERSVSAVIPRSRGGYVLTMVDGVYAVERIEQGAPLELLKAIEADLPDNRLNDAKCDPSGRLWLGTLAGPWKPQAGSLYRLDPNLELTRVAHGTTVSNGLGWSPDGARLYFADSGPRQVYVFDFDAATGVASNQRLFVELPGVAGAPDGLAVDADGFVWVAAWGAGALHRYAPDGALERVRSIPVTNVATCCFGGSDLGDLYVATAWHGLDDEEHTATPHAGGLFGVRPPVRGMPTVPFAG